jgi:coenzyme F420-reducing hydrogenase delta subunit/ferredoxin
MNDRFFSLAIFLHIGLPLALLAGCWIHFLRLSHVRAWPPAALTAGSLAALCALALAQPVTSLAPASALHAPATIAIDWFYLFPHALAESITPEGLWAATLALAIALTALPWLPGRAIASAARVDLANCNGCARCAADCPFGAVVMAPRSDSRPHPREARVIPDLCAACGICAGACPSSTPFRRIEVLASGIDLPDFPIERLRAALDGALDREAHPVIVFGCARANLPRVPDAPGVATIEAECAAMVPPAFVEYALRSGAAGVVIAGCRAGDCEFRLGDRWIEERFAAQRDPVLRASVQRDRMAVAWAGSDRAAVDAAIEALTRLPRPAGAAFARSPRVARSPPPRGSGRGA